MTQEQKQRIADAFFEGGYCFGVYADCIQIDGFIPWEVFEKIMNNNDKQGTATTASEVPR